VFLFEKKGAKTEEESKRVLLFTEYSLFTLETDPGAEVELVPQ
jgi:hypothetical protein